MARSSQASAAIGWTVAAILVLAFATALPAGSAAAAKRTGPEEPTPQAETKSPAKSDAHKGEKASDTAKAKQSETPGEKAADDTPGKDEDRCDPKKHLIDFELRLRLCQSGLELQITETSEIFGNLTGGLRQSALYEGLTDLNLRIDLRRSLHWRSEIYARAYQIHGRGLTANNIGNLDTILSCGGMLSRWGVIQDE